MQDIILHHYPNSPFAEKVRLMLGYKKLPWKSVFIPVIMPKPDLMPLTGGYRRTPVMQIGADIYCDTALIADVLERLAPAPSLYPPPVAGLARIIAQWADSALFWAAVPFALQPAGVPDILGDLAPEQLKAFAADRSAMRAGAPRAAIGESAGHLQEYLQRINDMLSDGRPYLLGDRPTIADFSVYHSFWFVRKAKALLAVFDATPRILQWVDRMAAIGHGSSENWSAAQALAVARESRPASEPDMPLLNTHGITLGQQVAIMPNDYAFDPVEGELAISNATQIGVRRSDERTGTVVVHFPRVGFQMKKI